MRKAFSLILILLFSVNANAGAVVWSNVANATDSGGGTLTSSGNSTWSHSGGYNTSESIATGVGGSLCVTPNSTDKISIFGLTHNFTTIGDYTNNNFSIGLDAACNAAGNWCVYENGVLKGSSSRTFSNGDALCVVVSAANVVTYTQNASLIYTSLTTPTFPIYVDGCLYDNGGVIRTAVFTTVSGIGQAAFFTVF